MKYGLTEAEAREMLACLASEFELQTPALSWTFRARRGRASYKKHRIVCGPLCWRGAEPSLVHEFAHLLAYSRDKGVAHTHHGKVFQEALEDAAIAWYGNAGEYPWANEYKSVAAYGRKRGL